MLSITSYREIKPWRWLHCALLYNATQIGINRRESRGHWLWIAQAEHRACSRQLVRMENKKWFGLSNHLIFWCCLVAPGALKKSISVSCNGFLTSHVEPDCMKCLYCHLVSRQCVYIQCHLDSWGATAAATACLLDQSEIINNKQGLLYRGMSSFKFKLMN